MKIIKIFVFALFITWLVAFAQSCQQPGGNTSGSEYMPDMSHSIAYEANYYNYYYNNTWNGQDDYYKFAKPRTPVKGTIPRGYAGVYFASSKADGEASMAMSTGLDSERGIPYRPSGAVPYDYENTEEERIRAMAEIIINPYPITDAGLLVGKELYTIYCGICHGDKGDGVGFLVREASPGDAGGKYPVQPANFLLPEFVESSNGRYYHSIMYGKNLMSGYSDKLSFEERWQVVHYIRSLQAKELQLVYNQTENTLNAIDSPAGISVPEQVQPVEPEDRQTGEHQTDDTHGQTGHESEH